MQIEQLIIAEEATVLDAMHKLDETGHTILFVAPEGVLRAVVTDADVRRHIIRGGKLDAPVREMANYHPKTLPVERRSEARGLMRRANISAVPLLDREGHIEDVEFAGELDVAAASRAKLPVVIMAGGLGTRLYPYTKILPKPLIPVGELPIVEHIIHRFTDVGCTDFTLVVNYKKNMIKSYFSELEHDYRVDYADEDKPLGTGGGLSLLRGRIRETFFLTNCDILIDADFADILDTHRKNGDDITMVCAEKHYTIPYGVVEADETDAVTAMREKPRMDFYTNTGMYVVEPRVLDDIRPDTPTPFTDVIGAVRARGGRVGVYRVSEESWLDMGQMEELENMRRRLEQRSQ